MGNRLSSIVTKTGDNGTTSLDGQSRCAKSAPLIGLVGELDEFNSALGVVIATSRASRVLEHPKWHAEMLESLLAIQHDLFSMGGSVVLASNLLAADRCEALERQINDWLAALPPLKEFILPGGSAAGAQLHLARAIGRRVERAWWSAYAEALSSESTHFAVPQGQYLNRLADWLFVAARLHNQMEAHPETLWRNPTKAG